MEQQLSIFDRRKTVVAVLRPTDRLIQTIVEIDGRLYFEQRHKEPFPRGSYSSLKKANTQLVAFCTKQATKRRYKKIELDITWYCKNKRKDKDNIMAGTKFILDGLVAAGTIQNDGWANVGDIRHKFDVDKQDPRVEIKITEVAG